MDVFAHAMFGGALAKGLQEKKIGRAPKLGWAMFWGAFPDLFAFAPSFVLGVLSRFSGEAWWAENLSHSLYNFSHSLVIFLVVFIILRLVTKRWHLVLLGWPLHVVFDMPLHSPEFFPTPFLYPISSWHLPFGIPWSTPWIWISTWVIIVLIYSYFVFREYHKKRLHKK